MYLPGGTPSDHLKQLSKFIFLPFAYHQTYRRGGEGMH